MESLSREKLVRKNACLKDGGKVGNHRRRIKVTVKKENVKSLTKRQSVTAKLRVNSSRRKGMSDGLLQCRLEERPSKRWTVKKILQLNKLDAKFNEGHEDDYFSSKSNSRRKCGKKLWTGKLLPDDDQSSDEEELSLKQTPVGQTVDHKDFDNSAEKEDNFKKTMEEHSEVKEFVEESKVEGSASPSHWCSAVASYTLEANNRRNHKTSKKAEWRSPSPSVLTEKQHAAFQARKLKEINNRKGKSRKTYLVRCLQEDFVKKENSGSFGAVPNCKKTDFGSLLTQIKCFAMQKEEECSESEVEEYFSEL